MRFVRVRQSGKMLSVSQVTTGELFLPENINQEKTIWIFKASFCCVLVIWW